MIYNKYIDGGVFEKFENAFEFVRSKVSFKSILFIILTFILTNQTFITDISPFSYVMFAVASVFNVPLILVLLSSVVSLFTVGITTTILIKLLAFFVVFTFITAILNIEGISRRYSVFIKFISSYLIVDLVYNFFANTLITGLFSNIGALLIISILYFIFVYGIYVLVNMKKGYVYSKEESISMVVVLALCTTIFSSIDIYGYSIVNVLVSIIILIYGWKNGPVVATCGGIIVGILLSFIIDSSMMFAVGLAISGALAGVFRKFGKISVVIAFVLGNVYLSYYTNNFTELSLRASEILIASLALLFMPKRLEISLDKFFNKNNTLQKAYENVLSSSTQAKNKIGALSELFENLSEINIENTPEYKDETRSVISKYIVDYVDNSCLGCAKRYNCKNDKNLEFTVGHIASKLENDSPIDKTMLTNQCEKAENIITDIKEVYAGMKLMRVLKQKEKENSSKVCSQYKEVSKILSNISKSIVDAPEKIDDMQLKLRDELKFYGFIVYEDELKKDGNNIEYTFITDILTSIEKQKKQIVSLTSDILQQNVSIKLILNSSKKEKSKIKIVTEPDYEVKSSVLQECKLNENVSGDSYLITELADMKQISIISDGAGSGISAAKASQTVINMLEKLLNGGFDEKKSVQIINSVIKLKSNESVYSTLDAFVLDLKTGDAEFIKIGSAPTYIVQNSKITTITNLNIPLGLVNDADYLPIVKKLNDNDIIVQLSDGVVNENINQYDNHITRYLSNLDNFKNPKQITDDLQRLILKENKNELNDDITVIVTKIKNKSVKT